MKGKQIQITYFNGIDFKPRNYYYISDIYNICDILLREYSMWNKDLWFILNLN